MRVVCVWGGPCAPRGCGARLEGLCGAVVWGWRGAGRRHAAGANRARPAPRRVARSGHRPASMAPPVHNRGTAGMPVRGGVVQCAVPLAPANSFGGVCVRWGVQVWADGAGCVDQDQGRAGLHADLPPVGCALPAVLTGVRGAVMRGHRGGAGRPPFPPSVGGDAVGRCVHCTCAPVCLVGVRVRACEAFCWSGGCCVRGPGHAGRASAARAP
jgi:hypothetical protein